MSICLIQRDPRRHRRHDDRLYIYPAARALGRGSVLRFLGRNPLRLIAVLLTHPGAIVAQDDLIQALWGDDPDGGPDIASYAINSTIFQLRKITPDLGVCIERQKTRGVSASLLPLDLSLDLRRASR